MLLDRHITRFQRLLTVLNAVELFKIFDCNYVTNISIFNTALFVSNKKKVWCLTLELLTVNIAPEISKKLIKPLISQYFFV